MSRTEAKGASPMDSLENHQMKVSALWELSR